MKKKIKRMIILVAVFCFSCNIMLVNAEFNGGVPLNFVPNFEKEYDMSNWLLSASYDLNLRAYEDLSKPAYKGELILAIMRLFQAPTSYQPIEISENELDKFYDNYTIVPNSSQESQLKVAVKLGMLTGEKYNDIWYMNLGNTLTRAQTAKILAVFIKYTEEFEYEDYSGKFDDISGHWAEEYIKYCYESGIMKGKEYKVFAPEEPVTKEEVIQILINLMDRNSIYSWQNVALAINQTFCVTTKYDSVNQPTVPKFTTSSNKLIVSQRRTYTAIVDSDITITLNHDSSRKVSVEVISANYNLPVCCNIENIVTNEGVTTVDINAYKTGVSLLECKYTYGSSSNEYVYVPIYVVDRLSSYYEPVKKISVYCDTEIKLDEGDTYNISKYVSVYPSSASNTEIFYTSLDPSVATVDYLTGRIKAIDKGTTYVYAVAEGYETRFKIIVSSLSSNNSSYDKITKIILDEDEGTFEVGDTFDLKEYISVKPSYYDTDTLTYSSNNKSVATVSSSGIVKMKKEGEAVITIRSYSGKKAKFTVYVLEDEWVEILPDDNPIEPEPDDLIESDIPDESS